MVLPSLVNSIENFSTILFLNLEFNFYFVRNITTTAAAASTTTTKNNNNINNDYNHNNIYNHIHNKTAFVTKLTGSLSWHFFLKKFLLEEKKIYQWVKSLLTEEHFSASIHTYELLKWQNLRCTFLSNLLILPSLLVEIQQIQIIITGYSVALRMIDWLLSLRVILYYWAGKFLKWWSARTS